MHKILKLVGYPIAPPINRTQGMTQTTKKLFTLQARFDFRCVMLAGKLA